MSATILFARHPNLERSWPYLSEPLIARLNALGETRVVNVERDTPLGEVTDRQSLRSRCLAVN